MERFLRFTWARETGIGKVWMVASLSYATIIAGLVVYFFACIAPWPVFVLVFGIIGFSVLTASTIIYLIERIDTFKEYQRIEQRREEQRARDYETIARRELERQTAGR